MKSALYFLSLTAMTALSSPALAGVINLPQTGQTIQAAAGDDGALLKGAVWPASRFIANPDQTVSDSLSGLVWNSNGNTHTPTGQCGVSGTNRSWGDALAYVACLNSSVYLGFTDWRLPTVTELGTLPSAGQPDSAAWLNSQGFSAVQSRFYWSSTSDASVPPILPGPFSSAAALRSATTRPPPFRASLCGAARSVSPCRFIPPTTGEAAKSSVSLLETMGPCARR